MMRADAAQVTHGWRILAGALTIDGVVDNAAVLLSPDLEVLKTWHLTETAVGGQKPRAKARRFVHGIAYLPDGSLIFTFDGAISLQRIGPCGEHIWATGGNFNHTVTLDVLGHRGLEKIRTGPREGFRRQWQNPSADLDGRHHRRQSRDRHP